jgi:hypothetical protein
MWTSKLLYLNVFFLLLCGCSATAPKSGSERVEEAEQIASVYMKSLFGGEIRAAAELTHPSNILGMHNSFHDEIKKQIAKGTEKPFLAGVNLTDNAATLLELSPIDLYVKILEAQRMKEPLFAREAMKHTIISVLDSRMVSTDTAEVRLQITNPTKNGTFTQKTVLLLSRHNDTWRTSTQTAIPRKRRT